jgi:DNA-binding response OmpR family regulator
MRVLIIEDYNPLRTALVQSLREHGFSVDESGDGRDGLFQASSGEHDLIVLDLMLPGIDGFEVLEKLRSGGRESHVLILTARDGIDDRVRGLDLGADDYLVKPFAMREFLARVRALVRRSYQRKSPRLSIGHVEIDTNDHSVQVDGEAVELTAKEYALLEYLALRCDQVVSRLEIWEHVYDSRSDSTSNVVDVYVSYLRKKLERDGKPKLIHTRRGEGYMLSAKER